MGYERLGTSKASCSVRTTTILAPNINHVPMTTQPTRKKLLVSLTVVAFILILPAAVFGSQLKSSQHVPGQARKPSQAISKACDLARFPELCVDSLMNFPGTLAASSDNNLLHVTVNMTLHHFNHALYSSSSLSFLDMPPRVRSAYDACIELLDDSVDALSRALSSVSGGQTKPQDVMTWLSSALTNHDTCAEGFDGVNDGGVKDQMTAALKNLSELVSNCLAIFAASSNGNDFSGVPIQNRRLLEVGGDENSKFPRWTKRREREILEMQVSQIQADIIVSKDGNGTCKTISEAIKKAPQYSPSRTIIYVKAGRYEENNLKVGRKKINLMFVGDGKGKTIISGGKSIFDNITTFHTATFAATGAGFIARDITFENYAGPAKHQAVALRVGADHAVIYRCNIIGYQDTLYVHSNRQFFRECDIYGTVDFIFGNAAVKKLRLFALQGRGKVRNETFFENLLPFFNSFEGEKMKQCSLGIDGLRSSLSPSSIDSSSLTLSASKSEHEDSIFRDYTLDLSFLSSDDSLSRDVDTTTKERQEKTALLNPNPLVSKLPEMLIVSSTVAGDGELELSCANATENSSTDSEEDTPCWIGINSRETLASGGAICRRSTDDLSGFRRLNPLAPQFIPSNSIKILEKDEKNGSSSLKKSLSSDFPSSSGEFNLDDAASILADESLGFVSQDSVSRNEFQQSKRLDPLAPVFLPSNAKLTPSVHEAFETNAHSTSALTYSDNKSLGKVKIDTPSGEAGRIHISGSCNPWLESTVGLTESAKLGSSSNKSRGQRRLNPLAPQFSLSVTKPKAYSYEKYQAVDGSSSLKSPTADSNFGSTKWYAVEPNTTLSANGNQDFQHPFPFHVVETSAGSSSRNAKALSGGSSPKMDVMKLLTTIHGLSELLTLAHGSESSDSPEELDLINSTVQNLNMYIQNGIQEQSVVQHNSYDLQLLSNKSKLSIRDLQLPSTNNMTVDLGVTRKEKYSVVSGETFPDSGLYQYGVTKDEGFGQVVAKSGYQQNHQGEEQINPHALFYKSLWLKAEADRCLMVYETSLSNPGS